MRDALPQRTQVHQVFSGDQHETSGDAGLPLNVVNPQAYAAKAQAHGKTRAQVEAELREATRTGNVLAGGETGLLLNQLYPERYANVVPAAGIPMGAASSTEMLR